MPGLVTPTATPGPTGWGKYRSLGTTTNNGADPARGYIAGGYAISSNLSTGTPTPGNRYAVPFLTPASVTAVKELRFFITSPAANGNTGRMGIYANVAGYSAWPGSLLADLGTTDTAVGGVKVFTAGVAVTPDTLYWAAYGFSAAAPAVRVITPAAMHPLLGNELGMTNSSHVSVVIDSGAPGSGAMGATFSLTGGQQQVNPPAILVVYQ